ncbi:chromodomain-helicase-DNA-binding protein 1-like [Elysia marginata]|uniref:Chromodomain-helicase-DNA-binding protein 1-like n=1 Tax=Elysia marginata TaxID=1093978 RepID=A0AAV4G0A9_9GAST|nr:chromodomain-helicase-DNA-binding protein 1-like [Elysia marginata]
MNAEPMEVTQSLLKKQNWGDLELRSYQLEGVSWLLDCYQQNHGCILSDEMGLGKTCQTIAMLTLVKGLKLSDKPHLVVCPRSVLENWEREFNRFSPSFEVLMYIGDKEERAELAKNFKAHFKTGKKPFDVLLTTYELCLKDYLFLNSIPWNVLVVDEGHRLKNKESLLYKTLDEWDIDIHILLTGTPLQNNMVELYSLLSFVDSTKFKLSRADRFVQKFSSENQDMKELHDLLVPYLLRRTKAEVLKDLPEKRDIVLYHGLSAVQKKLYKAILTKDLDVFETGPGAKPTRLMNVLIQLRKCVNHPYLFDGVEPEPFAAGEHLVEASHKLVLIDKLLASLHSNGHKVLLFSQMARMLDVLQDYLAYRGYSYERLDGSVRGEERFLAVQNFNSNDETFAFLLSTRAGGQGLNLTAADTVIFVDSDFNPQNDLQAAARAHRIGQERPVKIIRLIGRNTVEEIILRRAEEKLKLTEKVIESGQFSTPSTSKQSILGQDTAQLQDILKFGVDELLAEARADELLDFEAILGESRDGQWVSEDRAEDKQESREKLPDKGDNEEEDDNGTQIQSMYMFEGTDYSKEPSTADLKAFDQLIQAEKEIAEAKAGGERTLRRAGTSVTSLLPLPERKPKKQLTPEELEERRKKREEAEAKRAKQAAQQKILRAQALKKKREQLWSANRYVSSAILLASDGEEEEEEEPTTSSSSSGMGKNFSLTLEMDSEDNDDYGDNGHTTGEEGTSGRKKKLAIRYVMGDVTHPLDANTADNIIVHCADNSGTWGQGGLFSAISARSSKAEEQYEFAGRMKDLSLGDCHLIPVDDIESREDGREFLALIVAQERDKRSNKLSGIKLSALETGLKKVCKVAQEKQASVHLPRIGQSTPGFNWYGTERLIQKYLASQGVPTLIYYFPRKQHGTKRKQPQPANQGPSKVSKNANNGQTPTAMLAASSSTSTVSQTSTNDASSKLPTLFAGMKLYFHDLPEDESKKLRRFALAYPLEFVDFSLTDVTYDGDVERSWTKSVTHVISSDTCDKEKLRDMMDDSDLPVVNKTWLEDCVSKGKLLPTNGYLVSLS